MQDALAVDDLVVLLERLAADAVPALIRFLVEVARRVVEDLLDEPLDARLVRRICSPNELIVGDAEQAPDFARALGNGVDQFLRRHFSIGCGLRDLLAVFVHPDQEVDLVASQPMIAGNGVGADFLECMTLMRISGGVIDRSG